MTTTQSTPIKWDIIPPEIKNDSFYYSIIDLLSKDKEIKNVIEIGASSGEGSTEALMLGKLKNKQQYSANNSIAIYSIEVCTERFKRLKNRYENVEHFYPYNVSSVSIEHFPAKKNIIDFYKTTHTTLNKYPIDMILSWYDNDIDYISKNNIKQNGIESIKRETGISNFDVALIDGSEFTGEMELLQLWGTKYILLDDINAYKNYNGHLKLKQSAEYKCLIENYNTRNGFSIFVKN